METKKENEENSEFFHHFKWTERLMNDPKIKMSMQQGIFGYSVESIVRVCRNIDARSAVEVTTEEMVMCVWHLAGDEIPTDLKSWALAVLAQALAKKDSAYKLVLSQRAAGRRPPQSSDMLRDMMEAFYIDRSAQEAEAQGLRSPNKVAAREHGCSLAEVKRARAQMRYMRALAGNQAN